MTMICDALCWWIDTVQPRHSVTPWVADCSHPPPKMAASSEHTEDKLEIECIIHPSLQVWSCIQHVIV